MNLSFLEGYKENIVSIINGILIPVLIAIAFLVFLWGVYKYFIKDGDNESEREKGKTFVLYGIIGFVIIFSVWGLVNIVSDTLNLSPGSTAPTAPRI